ncbi:MAG: hypothetical protein QXX51_07600 [Candidatus Bathyarchaeia archaeon]
MKGKFVLGVVVLLLLGVLLQFHEVNAIAPMLDQSAGDSSSVYNIQPVEDFWPNLTLPMYDVKHRFPADYSSGVEVDGETPLDSVYGSDTAVSVVPEFPPVLILPVFLALTLFGVIACKKSASFNMRRA